MSDDFKFFDDESEDPPKKSKKRAKTIATSDAEDSGQDDQGGSKKPKKATNPSKPSKPPKPTKAKKPIEAVDEETEDTDEPSESKSSQRDSSESVNPGDLSGLSSKSLPVLAKPTYPLSRIHTIKQNNDFFLVFYDSDLFKTLISVVHPILKEIQFKVVAKKSMRGITVNSIDENKSAMVVARLPADEMFAEEMSEQKFCVTSESFASMVKALKSNCCLEIRREKRSSRIDIRCYQPAKKNYESSIQIPTLNKDDDEVPQMKILDYNFILDIDLNILRSITRVASNGGVSAQNIRFLISERNLDDATKITRVTISMDAPEGNPSMDHTFRFKTSMENDAQQTVLKIDDCLNEEEVARLVEEEEMVNLYDQRFSTKYLQTLLKPMDRDKVQLRLSPNRPLVLTYPVGPEGYVNFLLAPNVTED